MVPHLCHFARVGFSLDGQSFLPCGTTYHMGCICVGLPFCSRLPARWGLQYPRTRIAPTFICEACTVRAQIGTELLAGRKHLALLMLERMRLIDQANAWLQGTHRNYQVLLSKLTRFQVAYGVPLLQPTPLAHPPWHPSIGVMWAQQQYTLQRPSSVHFQSGADRVMFGTARAPLRSAASQYYIGINRLPIPTEHFVIRRPNRSILQRASVPLTLWGMV
jgi:hypothetical protein